MRSILEDTTQNKQRNSMQMGLGWYLFFCPACIKPHTMLFWKTSTPRNNYSVRYSTCWLINLSPRLLGATQIKSKKIVLSLRLAFVSALLCFRPISWRAVKRLQPGAKICGCVLIIRLAWFFPMLMVLLSLRLLHPACMRYFSPCPSLGDYTLPVHSDFYDRLFLSNYFFFFKGHTQTAPLAFITRVGIGNQRSKACISWSVLWLFPLCPIVDKVLC